MKNLLLIFAFLLGMPFGYAEEGAKGKKRNHVPNTAITYREHKAKPTVARKKTPKKHMFDGEGPRRSELSIFGKEEKRTGNKNN